MTTEVVEAASPLTPLFAGSLFGLGGYLVTKTLLFSDTVKSDDGSIIGGLNDILQGVEGLGEDAIGLLTGDLEYYLIAAGGGVATYMIVESVTGLMILPSVMSAGAGMITAIAWAIENPDKIANSSLAGCADGCQNKCKAYNDDGSTDIWGTIKNSAENNPVGIFGGIIGVGYSYGKSLFSDSCKN